MFDMYGYVPPPPLPSRRLRYILPRPWLVAGFRMMARNTFGGATVAALVTWPGVLDHVVDGMPQRIQDELRPASKLE